jgi:PAS domain S-box-containing protein
MRNRYSLPWYFVLVVASTVIISSAAIFRSMNELVLNQQLDFLNTQAASQAERVRQIIASGQSTMRLLQSRSALQAAIVTYARAKDADAGRLIRSRFTEVLHAQTDILRLSILDASGSVILSSDADEEGSPARKDEETPVPVSGIRYNLLRSSGGIIRARLTADVSQSGAVIGRFEVLRKADDLAAVMGDFTGLGKTGETALGERQRNGDVLVLWPLRFDASAGMSRLVSGKNLSVPIVRASAGEEGIYTDITDYRGKTIVAATRYISENGWALLVKMDKSELLAPLYRQEMLAVGYLAFLVVLASAVMRVLTAAYVRPLKRLITAAQGIAEDKLTDAVTVRGDGEVQDLIDEFEQMRLHLSRRRQEFHEEVRVKSAQLETEIQKAKLFRSALDESTDPVMIIDASYGYVYVNAAFERLTGFLQTELDTPEGRSLVQKSFNDANEPAHLAALSDAMSRGLPYRSDEFIVRRKDGFIYSISLSEYPVFQDGQARFFVLNHKDISDRKRSERAKNEFVALASHQLRTPVSEVRWVLSSLRKDPGMTEEQIRLLDSAHDAAVGMAGTIETLLTVSRIEEKKLEPLIEDVQIRPLLEGVIAHLETRWKKTSVRCELRCDPDLRVRTDAKLLREVVVNLIDNAFKYSDKGGLVTILAERRDDCFVLKVRDHGCGIPVNQQDMLSNKYFRADNVVSGSIAGSGIGLYLVYALARLLRGSVNVESREREGSTFLLTFPLSYDQESR